MCASTKMTNEQGANRQCLYDFHTPSPSARLSLAVRLRAGSGTRRGWWLAIVAVVAAAPNFGRRPRQDRSMSQHHQILGVPVEEAPRGIASAYRDLARCCYRGRGHTRAY